MYMVRRVVCSFSVWIVTLMLDAVIHMLHFSMCLLPAHYHLAIAAQKSKSDDFIHRIVVHYYAKGDKCDVTGKHRDVQVRMK